ncbi:MAG: zinc-binding dehydrogenase [Nitrospirae bacterium]|nr:zinc-binding dehydrogenase [Nitrospirota bacterium]
MAVRRSFSLLTSLLVKPGKIELREVKSPRPSKGDVLVKIKTALTCGTDLKAFLRGHPLIPMPGVFGHEFSGVVAEVGKGVQRFKKGDEIMAVHSAPCLECKYCKKRAYNLCEKIMWTKVLGAFAEYILLPPHVVRHNAFHKPKNITFEEASFLEPLSCVVHGIEPLDIKKGDSVLVIGAGSIGLLHLLCLKAKGAIVAATDINAEKLKIAKKLDADFTFKPETIETNLKKIASGIGFDYVFECTGTPEVWDASVNYVRRGGTVILFGGCKSGTAVTYDTGRLHYDEITLKGVFHYTPADVRKAYKLIGEEKLGLSRLISGSYPLRDIEKAFNKLAKGTGIKYAIIP